MDSRFRPTLSTYVVYQSFLQEGIRRLHAMHWRNTCRTAKSRNQIISAVGTVISDLIKQSYC